MEKLLHKCLLNRRFELKYDINILYNIFPLSSRPISLNGSWVCCRSVLLPDVVVLLTWDQWCAGAGCADVGAHSWAHSGTVLKLLIGCQ